MFGGESKSSSSPKMYKLSKSLSIPQTTACPLESGKQNEIFVSLLLGLHRIHVMLSVYVFVIALIEQYP